MAELIGVVFSLVLLAIVFVPVFTFLRLGRLSREIEELTARVAHLEAAAAQRAAAVTAPRPSAAPPPPALDSVPAAPIPTTPRPVDGELDVIPVSAPPLPRSPAGTHAARAVETEPPQSTAAAGMSSGYTAATGPAAGRGAESVTPEPDFEERLGGRGLLYMGVLVLLLGVSFFLKYAFDNAWINETGRTVLGAAAGIGLILGGLRFARHGFDAFGQALVGMGFAVLYLVIYAALNYYLLIGRGFAFVLMIAITIAAAMVADRQRSQPLAFIAVGGGFLTPALVGGDENAQLTLFSYVALLVIGTMLLSFRQQWLALNALSYIGTFLTVVVWAGRFYTDDQWLRTLLFLTLYCVAFLIILRETRRRTTPAGRALSGLLSTAVVFYHVAAIVITADHPPAIHVYLIAFTVVGLWLTADPHRAALRLALLLGAFVPMFGTVTLPDGRSWIVPNLITMVSVAALHVLGLLDRAVRQSQRLTGADLLAVHVTGLGLFALLYELLQPVWPWFRGGLAALVALGAAAMWRSLRERDAIAALNAAALALVLLAIGIGVQFDGPTVTIGWAAEGAAATWLGVRARHRGFQLGGLLLWALAAVRLFDSFAQTPAAFTALLNARSFATVFVVASGYLAAWRLGASGAPEAGRLRVAVHVVASAVTLRWLTAEIQSFWEVRADRPQAFLYEQMLLSLVWGLYGAALIAVGMVRKYAPLRYIGMSVIAAASLKVFFYDLWELGGIYRVIGFISFGVLLVLVSYLYQHRRRATAGETGSDAES